MEKFERNFIVCYDTGIDYNYEFDPEDPDRDNPKEKDFVPLTAETMEEALEKSADVILKETGQNYPIDFVGTMKYSVNHHITMYDKNDEEYINFFPDDLEDIVKYINENSVDADLPAIFEALAKDELADVREAVAENSHTSAEMLETLAKDEDAEVRWAVANNRNTPVATLETLAKDENPYVRRNVVVGRDLSELSAAIVDALAKDKDPVLHEALLNCSSDVRCEVAKNENTPVATLKALAKDYNAYVRCAVAENENTPVATLKMLAKENYLDELSEVVRELAQENLDFHYFKQSGQLEPEKLVISASDLKEAKAEKDVRDAAAPKNEQQRQKSQDHEMG